MDAERSMTQESGMPQQNVIHSVAWYHKGQCRTIEVEGVWITIRLVSRKGRRSRIAITVPSGASFLDVQPKQ
jgi:hypothetical protein